WLMWRDGRYTTLKEGERTEYAVSSSFQAKPSLKWRNGRGQPASRGKTLGALAAGVCGMGTETSGRGRCTNTRVQAPFREAGHTTIVVRIGIFGIQMYIFQKLAHGLIGFAFFRESNTEVVMRFRISWIETSRFQILADGFLNAVFFEERVAHIFMRNSIIL